MMLRSRVFRAVALAYRFHRAGFLACGGIGLISGLLQARVFQTAAATPAQRIKFGHDMAVLARQISYLLPIPVHPETMAGYLQWRVFGAMPLIVGVWAFLSATGVVRGEEEHGLTEAWLNAGISRSTLVFTRLGGFAIVAAGVSILTALGCDVGAAAAGSPLEVGRLLGQVTALVALSIACFGISLLVAQFVATRVGAASWAAVVLLVLYLLNSLSRTAPHPGAYRWLSTFYYYDRSDPLAPGGHLDIAGTALLLVSALLTTALATAAFRRRDLGAGLVSARRSTTSPVRVPSRNPLLRLPVLPAIYEQRLSLLSWLAGTAVMAAYFVSLAKQGADSIRQIPSLYHYLTSLGGGSLDRAFIGAYWFGVFQLALAAYAITQVSRWAAEDTEGRLELELSHPIRRRRVVIERAVMLALTCGIIIAISGLAVIAVAPWQHVTLSTEDVLRASVPLLPFALAFGAIGAALEGRVSRAAVMILSIIAVAGYLLYQVGPILQWPGWLNNLSVFQLYDTPLTNGIFWNGFWAMTAVTLAGFAVALWAMERRDVGQRG